MLPRNPKRVLAKNAPNNNDRPSKRPKASERTPVVTKGIGCVPNVKSEEITDFMDVNTVLKNRNTLSPKDLPPECLHVFRIAFRPAIRDLVGTLGPWESPADTDVIRIWNNNFPKHRVELSEHLYTIVSKLVEDTVKNWRRDIAITAVECLNTHLKSSFNNQRERVAHATWLLGDDEKDRKRPFYYKKYAKGVQPSGIFQSSIIAATLAAHLSSISRLPEESRLQNYPTGALALSILAVKRALTWTKTGTNAIPQTSEGHFSRANWGDHYRLEDGQYVLVKSASNIVTVISKLRDVQWERILAEAEKFVTQKNGSAALKAVPEDTQSEFELEDWDDDFE